MLILHQGPRTYSALKPYVLRQTVQSYRMAHMLAHSSRKCQATMLPWVPYTAEFVGKALFVRSGLQGFHNLGNLVPTKHEATCSLGLKTQIGLLEQASMSKGQGINLSPIGPHHGRHDVAPILLAREQGAAPET